jgi:hypothetical protein
MRRILIAALLCMLCAVGAAAAQTVTGFASTMQALVGIYNLLAGTLTVSGSVSPLPINATGNYSPATVGTSASTIVATAGGNARYLVDIINLSGSATVCLDVGGTATISGSTCAAGEIPLAPGARQTWPQGAAGFVPSDAISAIASASATAMTVGLK